MAIATASMNFFAEGFDPPEASGELSLYTIATSGTRIIDDMPLYTYSTLNPGSLLPLYTNGGIGDSNASLNLFLQNIIPDTSGSLDLYISGPRYLDYENQYNEYVVVAESGILILPDGTYLALGETPNPNDMSLYISGLGPSGSDGFVPINANINLFMARDTEVIANSLSLYMAQHDTENSIDFYTQGHDTQYTIVSPFTTDNGLKDFANSYDTTINVVKDIDDVKSNVVPDSYGGASWSSDILERQYSATNLPQIELKDRTVCFWYKTPSDIPTTQTLTTSRVGNIAGTFIVSLDVDQQIVYANCPTSTLDGYASGDLSLVDDGGWHHYALMLDRDDDAKLFIDGIKTPHSVSVSGDQATSMSFNPTTSNLRNKFYIGNDNLLIASTSGNFYDYRIYDQPIANYEIMDIKNDTYGRQEPIVHYLPNYAQHLDLYIRGSGVGPNNNIKLYTHGY